MDEAYFHQLRRNIETLVAEGKLTEAFNQCNEVLQKHPDQEVFVDFKKTVAKKMLEKNKEKVKEGLKEVKTLRKNDRTEEALRKIKSLLELSPNNEKLKRLYLKVQKKYKRKLEETEGKFLEQKKKTFQDLVKKDQITQLLKELDTTESEYLGDKNIMTLVQSTREAVIQAAIAKKKELLNSTKFDDIRNFIQDLKNINKKSPIIKKLEDGIKRKQMGENIWNMEEFIYTGEHNLETLMKLGKYEEALVVSKELLKTDPENKEVKKIYKKARRKAFFQNRKETIKNIKEKLPSLKAEYQKNKENFVSI